MKNNSPDLTDEVVGVIEATPEIPEEEGNAGCQVRRKIEDLLERRRYKDELGEADDLLFE